MRGEEEPVVGGAAALRCSWVGADPLYVAYHDQEWGKPLHDERALFELLLLEGFQAGLAWITILRKRPRYREVFDGFDPERIAAYGPEKLAALLADPGIVRNRAKIAASVGNARAFLAMRERGEDFSPFLWSFIGGRPRVNDWRGPAQVPASTPESVAMSKALLQRGFRFVGPTICYAFMQASGMVDDHLAGCISREARKSSR